jgi:hypothetical protein
MPAALRIKLRNGLGSTSKGRPRQQRSGATLQPTAVEDHDSHTRHAATPGIPPLDGRRRAAQV